MGKSTRLIKKELAEGMHLGRLKDIYVDESLLEYQRERYIKAIDSFEKLYGERDVEIFSAPGRSEVGGNHTDHQYGKALAASINLDVIAIAAKTEDDIITLKSEGYDRVTVDLSILNPVEKEKETSAALIRGVAAGLKERGYRTGGFKAYAVSDVLSGSGLSSSAAYEIMIGTILSALYNDGRLDPILLAAVGQYAENRFFGKPCGLLDQLASSVGGLINIDFINPADPKVKKVDVDFGVYGHSLCIVDTKGSHADLTEDYASIPGEMKKVAGYFGKEVLREVDEMGFYRNISELRKKAGDRAVLRALHFFEENKRVDQEAGALEDGDFGYFKKLVKMSGDSSFKYLQNVYSVRKLEEQGLSVGLALSDVILGEKGASRVHGGGFAGTIQAFVPDDLVHDYKVVMEDAFGRGSCYILKIRKYGGIKVL